MNRILSKACLLAVAGLAYCGIANAQSPNGFASIIHVPVVVSTGTFHTTLFIHNPGGSVSVNAVFHGATGTADAGTPLNCGNTAFFRRDGGVKIGAGSISSSCFNTKSRAAGLRSVTSSRVKPCFVRRNSLGGNGWVG